MLWLNPSALFALAAAVAPILIHILVQRRAERLSFPTLQFLQPTRLAAIRRHVLDDPWLLAVRVALLACAVAALAGPRVVTSARRQSWDRRIVRAVVVDVASGSSVAGGVAPRDAGAEPGAPQPAQVRTFDSSSLPDGIGRAVLWLETAPPARREIVVASAFPIGSVTPADLAAIPADVGVRLARTGALPGTRTVPAGRVLTADGVRGLEVTLAADRTSARDTVVDDRETWPIEVVSSPSDRPAIDAAISAVLSQRVWAAPPGRRARLVVVSPAAHVATHAVIDGLADVFPMQQPWMADAAARVSRDPDLQTAAAGVPEGLADVRFGAAPWQPVVAAADGRPLAALAGSADRLVVASAAPPSDVATPVLLRSVANAIAPVPDLVRAEVVPIADAVLREWSRPSAPRASPGIGAVDQDDRRWLWLSALCLLGLETWLRRSRLSEAAFEAGEEGARVA